MLASLKQKINFGVDEYSLKMEFSWKDTLKNDFYTSFNVNFEYYNTLFNLAVIFKRLGSYFYGVQDDQKLKEGIKYFQHASWAFDKIKNELPTFLPAKEITPDLSANFLTFVFINYNLFSVLIFL